MQNFPQPFLPQIIQNNPPKDVASRTDLSSPTEMGSLSNSHIQFSSQARDEQVTSSKQRIEKNKEKHSWSITEEKLLASSWLTISTDSVIGNGQNDRAFWKRVAEYFNEAKHDGPTRLHSTVKNHWYWMMPMVNEFNQAYNKILSEHRSGWSDDQVKECAREIYYQNRKKHFNHEHVWLMVKNDPKWKANYSLPRSSKRSKTSESGAYTSSLNMDIPVDLDWNEDEERPIGQKAAKAKAKSKRKGKEKDTEKMTNEEWQEAWMNYNKKLEERVALAQDMKNAYDKKVDYEIFTRDTSGMTAEQLEQHRKFCDAIKARYVISHIFPK